MLHINDIVQERDGTLTGIVQGKKIDDYTGKTVYKVEWAIGDNDSMVAENMSRRQLVLKERISGMPKKLPPIKFARGTVVIFKRGKFELLGRVTKRELFSDALWVMEGRDRYKIQEKDVIRTIPPDEVKRNPNNKFKMHKIRRKKG